MIYQVFSDSLHSLNILYHYIQKNFLEIKVAPIAAPPDSAQCLHKAICFRAVSKIRVQISKKEHLLCRSFKSKFSFSICEEHSEAMTPQDWLGTTPSLLTMEESSL